MPESEHAPEPVRSLEPSWAPPEHPQFGFLDIVLVVVGGFFIMLLAQFVALGVAHSLPRFAAMPLTQLARQPLVVIPGQVVSYFLLIAFIHFLLFARYSRGLLELVPFRAPRRVLALAGIGVALALSIELLSHYLPIPKQLPIDEYFKERAAAWVMLAFGVFIAPFVEELFFRGLLYPVLNRALGAGTAVALTSLLFALLHASQLAFSWAPLLTLFIVGLALTLIRARFQSLVASIVVHMAYNATLFGMILVATRGFQHMEVLSR